MEAEAAILMALVSHMEMAVTLSSMLARGSARGERYRDKYYKMHKAISLARGVVLKTQFAPLEKPRQPTTSRKQSKGRSTIRREK